MARRLLAIQGQDPRGARLAVRARTDGLHASDVDAALNDRRLLIAWLNRGTLHLVRTADFWWLHALTTPQLRTGSDRRLAQEGVTPAALRRGLDIVRDAIAADGPQTREELRERLRSSRVPTAGQALIHVLFRAGVEGLVVRGPMRGRQHCYVLAEDWAGERPKVDRAVALRELGTRYLAGHAPADDRDLAKWAGITLADARRALADARPPRVPRHPDLPGPRLLGAFEPVLLGWADRTPILPPDRQAEIVSGGIFRPFVLHHGRAAGAWRLERGRVLCDVPGALGAEKADVERFLG